MYLNQWVVFAILCLARDAELGALRCTPGGSDTLCSSEEIEKEQPASIDEAEVQGSADGGAECLPGSEWDSNCYHCRCSSNARAVCSPVDGCTKEPKGEPLRCAPSSTFPRGCNSCICLETGHTLCTLRACSGSEAMKVTAIPAGRQCASGSSWQSQCNRCSCSPDGLPFCTYAACPGQEAEPERQCAPDTMWKNDCNTCWCTGQGLPVCTRIGCDNVAPLEIKDASSSKELVLEMEVLEKVGKIASSHGDDKETAYFDLGTENPINFERSIEDLDYTLNPPKGLEDVLPLPDQNNILEDTDYGDIDKAERHRLVKRSVCKPGQIFQNDCNNCKCSPDGQSYSCTQNECMDGEKNKEVEVFMESEGVDHAERHTVCVAKGTFYIGCNTCHCNSVGTDYSCTNKPCALPDDVELFHELKVPKSANSSKIVCVANRMFIKDCNTCWCNDDGTGFFCTRKVCVDLTEGDEKPEEIRLLHKECRPDEVFELDCNTCRCNADGKSFSCTRRACTDQVEDIKLEELQNPTLIRKTRATPQSEAPRACQPGQEFRLDCNKCLCDNDGKNFSCTRNDCNNGVGNGNGGGVRVRRDTTETLPMECVPGSVFDKECNVCRCTADGAHAVCAPNKRCAASAATNEAVENDVNSKLPESDPNFRCNPGEQSRLGCNDCTCSADGRSVFCTVRYCDKDN